MTVFEQQKQHAGTWQTIGLENRRKRSLIVKGDIWWLFYPKFILCFHSKGGGGGGDSSSTSIAGHQ